MSDDVLIFPRALPTAAFKHVNDAARAGGHHCPNELQFFAAEAADLAGLAFKIRDLLTEK